MKRILISVLMCLALPSGLFARDTLNVAIALPFKASSTPSNQAYALYSGAVMALREEGEDSLEVRAHVFDISVQKEFPRNELQEYDIMIGPFNTDEVRELAAQMPEGKFLISPIEPACIDLVDTMRIIHVPTLLAIQYNRLAKWVGDDFNPEDCVAVVHEAMSSTSPLEAVTEKFQNDGIPYTLFSVNSYEDISTMLSDVVAEEGITRIVLLSDNEEFAKRIIDVAGTVSSPGKVATYALSKLRTFASITTEAKVAAGVRLLAEYFSDPANPEVEAFRKNCEELYNCPPSQFTYHGYDIMKFFLNMFKRFGKDWANHFGTVSGKGLQSDFRYISYGTGYVNTSLRRIGYSDSGELERLD